ncbi:O-antigen ligase family protein [bacterium]|nr:O-antigen ligase family protein [bacterium]
MRTSARRQTGIPDGQSTFNLALIALLVLVSLEYVGIGTFVSGGQKLVMILSLGLFFSVFVIGGGWEVLSQRQTKLFLFFLTHTAVSMMWAIVTTYALTIFKVQLGYVTLFISAYLILTAAKKIEWFMLSVVLAHVFIVIINLDKFNQATRTGGFRAAYFLGDGNDLAWSLTIFLPFIIYFFVTGKTTIRRCLYLAAMIAFIIGIVGTGSRGAFLAAMASVLYLVLHSRHRLVTFAIVGFAVLVTLALAPAQYINRVESITDYQEDSSALGRITAWKAAGRMAVGHPLGVGAGNFNSAYGRFYKPEQFDDRIYAPERWISPHSIYFLVLGEYGVIGLATILWLLFTNYSTNQRQVRAVQKREPPIEHVPGTTLHLLPKYLNMSFVAFCVGGVFLGGINYPHLFILTALILKTSQLNAELLGGDRGQDPLPAKRSGRRTGKIPADSGAR